MSLAETSSRPTGLDLRVLFFAIALCMALIEFGQVWFFGADDRGLITSRPFGGAYRASLWLVCSFGLALHVLRNGPVPILTVIAPSLAFMVWGSIGVFLWSVDPVISIRTLIFWSFAVGIAASTGYELSARVLARTVGALFVAVLLASFILFLINPAAATGLWYDSVVFRGLFPQKNLLGWFMAVGLIFLWAQRAHFSIPEFCVAIGLLITGLLISGSASALVITISTISFMLWLRLTMALFNDGSLAFSATIIALVTAIGAVLFLFPYILEILGRDVTLTGRTDVWGHYLSYIRSNIASGYGPGLMSGTSPLTIAIGNTVPGHEGQGLFSAHSVFITILGEVGIVGLCFYAGGLLYIALVAPFRDNDPWSLLAAGLALAILISGIAESRDSYLPGIATILMFASRAQVARHQKIAFEARKHMQGG